MIAIFFCQSISKNVFAAKGETSPQCPKVPEGETPTPDDLECAGLVEVRFAPNMQLPWGQRKTTWSKIAALTFENHDLKDHKALATADTATPKTYGELLGTGKFTMTGVSFGIQANLGALGVNAGLGVAFGTKANEDTLSALAIQTQSLHVGVQLDPFSVEPYAVPFADLEYMTGTIKDQVGDLGKSIAISPEMAYSLGVLVQLNWMDKETAFEGLKTNKLNNSFLDLHLRQVGSGAISSGMNFGAGVRLQF